MLAEQLLPVDSSALSSLAVTCIAFSLKLFGPTIRYSTSLLTALLAMQHYGAQALVVSIDPRRVYVADPAHCSHNTVKARTPGPNGEQYCWYQCTVKGGREGRDIDAVQLAQAVEALGAGEILLNSIDADGACTGFDLELIQAVSNAVTIPVIASSGAGSPAHFSEVFNNTKASAALAAGIFHRQEVLISEVKNHMAADGLPTRT